MWIFLISFPKWHEKTHHDESRVLLRKWSKKFKVERIRTRFGLMNVVKSSLWIQEAKERRERERKERAREKKEEREDRIEERARLLFLQRMPFCCRRFFWDGRSVSSNLTTIHLLSPSFIQVSVWWTRDEKGRKKSSSSLFYSLFQHQLQYICREEEKAWKPILVIVRSSSLFLSHSIPYPIFHSLKQAVILSFFSSFPVDIFLPTQSQQLEKKLTASSSWTKKKPFVLASLRS